jgi:hypothetical protein
MFTLDYIANHITKYLFKQEKSEIVRFLLESTNESMLGSIQSYIFQQFAHSALYAGGKLGYINWQTTQCLGQQTLFISHRQSDGSQNHEHVQETLNVKFGTVQ